MTFFKVLQMLSIHAVFVHTSRAKFRFSFFNIMTLCETMVIDFLMFTSRPSAKPWSLISLCLHEDLLRDYGYWFPFFTSRPSAKQWSSILLHQDPLRGNGHWFLYHIEALYETMVIDLFSSRPFVKQWSLICLCLHQDPLWGNGHWFFSHIKALYEAMVIDLFTTRPSARQWSLISYVIIEALCEAMVIDFFTSRPSARHWLLISLSHRGPLRSNGHWFLSFWYRPSPWDWSKLFF